jgi:hypothetical protein
MYRPALLGAALPFLILAACPLSMLWMMRSMNHGEAGDTAPALPDDPVALRDRMSLLAAEQEKVSEQLARLATSTPSSDDGEPRRTATPVDPI